MDEQRRDNLDLNDQDPRVGLYFPGPSRVEKKNGGEANRVSSSAEAAGECSDDAMETPYRPGDSGVLIPPLIGRGIPLSPADKERIEAQEGIREAEERDKLEELLATEATIFRVPSLLTHSLAMLGLVGGITLFGLLVFAQVATTLAALATLPPWVRYPGWVCLGSLCGILAYVSVRILLPLQRLRTSRPIRLRQLIEVAERTQLRWLAHRRMAEAVDRVLEYVERYPIADHGEDRGLRRLGVDASLLKTRREDLRSACRDPKQWFDRYLERFQAPLDQAADRRVGFYARRIALMTASSPNAAIDALMTVYGGLAMLSDLCRIYNLRVGRLGTAVLLGRVFFNAYLAGRFQDSEAQVAEGIRELVSEAQPVASDTEGGGFLDILEEASTPGANLAIDAALARIAGKLGARSASGMLNYLLLKRLGRYAIRLLQPVHMC